MMIHTSQTLVIGYRPRLSESILGKAKDNAISSFVLDKSLQAVGRISRDFKACVTSKHESLIIK